MGVFHNFARVSQNLFQAVVDVMDVSRLPFW